MGSAALLEKDTSGPINHPQIDPSYTLRTELHVGQSPFSPVSGDNV